MDSTAILDEVGGRPDLFGSKLDELTGREVQAMFTKLAETDNQWGRRPAPSVTV